MSFGSWSIMHRIRFIKGIVHTKMKTLSFNNPQVVPNLHDFLSSAEHESRYLEEFGKLNS